MHIATYLVLARFSTDGRYCGEIVVARALEKHEAQTLADDIERHGNALVSAVQRATGAREMSVEVCEGQGEPSISVDEAKDLLASLVAQDTARSYVEPDDADFLAGRHIESASGRVAALVARKILRTAVREIIEAGYLIRVWDGRAMAVAATTSPTVVMAGIGRCDDETLYVRTPDPQDGVCSFGWIELMHGGAGFDVLRSFSPSMDALLARPVSLSLAFAAAMQPGILSAVPVVRIAQEDAGEETSLSVP